MKKLISLCFALSSIALTATACSPIDNSVNTENPTPMPETEPNPDTNPSDVSAFELSKGVNGKSSAQVILRWNLQKGVAVVPGSSNPDHFKENISIFDFELTDEQMSKINALNTNRKHGWY